MFWMNGRGIVQPNWPLGLLALAGIAGVAILGRGKPGLRSFVFGFLVFSFFCVCPGFYFRQHYFIVMLPAVAMLVGVGCRLLWDLAPGDSGPGAAGSDHGRRANAPPRSAAEARRFQAAASPSPALAAAVGFGPLTAVGGFAVAGGGWWNVMDAKRLLFHVEPAARLPAGPT